MTFARALTFSYGIAAIHSAADRCGIQKVSLSSLSITQLERKAADLRKMAETARAMDIRDALLRLAARYERLAVARDKESRGLDPGIDAWRLPPETPPGGSDTVSDRHVPR